MLIVSSPFFLSSPFSPPSSSLLLHSLGANHVMKQFATHFLAGWRRGRDCGRDIGWERARDWEILGKTSGAGGTLQVLWRDWWLEARSSTRHQDVPLETSCADVTPLICICSAPWRQIRMRPIYRSFGVTFPNFHHSLGPIHSFSYRRRPSGPWNRISFSHAFWFHFQIALKCWRCTDSPIWLARTNILSIWWILTSATPKSSVNPSFLPSFLPFNQQFKTFWPPMRILTHLANFLSFLFFDFFSFIRWPQFGNGSCAVNSNSPPN